MSGNMMIGASFASVSSIPIPCRASTELAGAIASAVARNGNPATPPSEPKPSTDVENRLAALEARLEERAQAIATERSKREQAESALAEEKAKARELAEAPSPFKGQVEEAKKRESALQKEIERLNQRLAKSDDKSQQLGERIERDAVSSPRAFVVGGALFALVTGAVGWWMVGLGGSSSSQVAELTEQDETLSARLSESEQATAAKERDLQETKRALAAVESSLESEAIERTGSNASTEANAYEPLSSFRDCENCPEMVVIPAGSFLMGSPDYEEGRDNDEGPQHRVTIGSPFAFGKHEVTFEEWDACVAAGGCDHDPNDNGWGRNRRPVINVSWEDAQQYVAWLSQEAGATYQLPIEAEWEYAARAFPTSKGLNPPAYTFGDKITEKQANFGRNVDKTVQVGSYPANDWGLYDMHGNVWEWVEDRWHDTYDGAPTDGRPWLEGNNSTRVLRGGSWSGDPVGLRSVNRSRDRPGYRNYNVGFRVTRTLTP